MMRDVFLGEFAGTFMMSGDGFEIECGQVVIAAGAATNSIASFLRCDIPAHPVRIEAMALEPVRLVLRPAVALLDRLCYRTQTRDPLRQCANPVLANSR
jgi:sarcosine oxidase subunit beta